MPNENRNATSAGRSSQTTPSGDPARRARIAIAAYYRAERRGFAPGREIEDWLDAEREVDRAGTAAAASSPEVTAPITTESAAPPPVTKAQTRKSRGGAQRTNRR